MCALLGGGGYAQRVAVPASHCLPVPRGVSLVDAAALPEVACTVWSNVFDLGRLQPLDTMLVHGGGSGIGTFAIQAAVAHGARVLTTARPAKHAALAELGAEVVIDYTTEDFVAAVRAATAGHGADVILDIMGGVLSGAQRRGAGHRTAGCSSSGCRAAAAAELDLGALLTKRARVIASGLRSRPADQKTAIVSAVREHLWPMVDSGLVRPIVHTRLPMPDASRAHALVESSDHFGKVVLTAPH